MSAKKVLALESSGSLASVALGWKGEVLAEVQQASSFQHSEWILQGIQSCLNQVGWDLSEIDIFATSRGPGRFTGVRVALSVIRCFAYTYKKQIWAPDALWLLAGQEGLEDSFCLVVVNAFRNMLFWSGVWKGEVLWGPEVIDRDSLFLEIDGKKKEMGRRLLPEGCPASFALVGDGVPLLGDLRELELLLGIPMEKKSGLSDSPLARTLVQKREEIEKNQGTLDWFSLSPLYLRSNLAEERRVSTRHHK